MNMVRIDSDIEELRNQLERTWGLLFCLNYQAQNNAEIMELGLVEALANAEIRLNRAITITKELVNIMFDPAPFHRLLALDNEIEFLKNEFTSMAERGRFDEIMRPQTISSANVAFEFGLDGIFYMLHEANVISSKVLLNSEVIPKNVA